MRAALAAGLNACLTAYAPSRVNDEYVFQCDPFLVLLSNICGEMVRNPLFA